jgi:hypothetical protein
MNRRYGRSKQLNVTIDELAGQCREIMEPNTLIPVNLPTADQR